jgi:hypothetical protein
MGSRSASRVLKALLIYFSQILFVTIGLAQATYIPFSNVNQVPAGNNGVWNAQTLAASFNTGSVTSYLASVSLGMKSANGIGGHFSVSIYNDTGSSPGNLLVTLSGNSTPTTTGLYIYTNSSVLALSANSTYWIVASSADAVGTNAFEWFYTFTGPDAGSFWTTGISKYNSGSGWNASGVIQMFSVTVTNPIPPEISLFQPLILTYPNPGFPLVLQQNTNLATTNWVAVTNVIQLKTVDTNQAVFIVQPNGQQMFYRLH